MKQIPINHRLAIIFAMLLGLFAPLTHASVVLQVNSNGILTGATGVVVGTEIYNVEFKDRTCIALYAGCVPTPDFNFGTKLNADAASQALLDTALLDGLAGQFDSVSSLTFGCSDLDQCFIVTAYSTFECWTGGPLCMYGSVAANRSASFMSGVDGVGTAIGGMTTAAGDYVDNITYAVWSPAPNSDIPEPSSFALLAVAGSALVWSQRRRRSNNISRLAQ